MLRASSGSTSAIFTLRQDRARSCWDLLHVAVLAAVPHVDYQVASTTAVADQLSLAAAGCTHLPEPCKPLTTPCTAWLPDKHTLRGRHRVGLSCELEPHMDRSKLYRTRHVRPVPNFTFTRTAWTRGLSAIRRRLVALRA